MRLVKTCEVDLWSRGVSISLLKVHWSMQTRSVQTRSDAAGTVGEGQLSVFHTITVQETVDA